MAAYSMTLYQCTANRENNHSKIEFIGQVHVTEYYVTENDPIRRFPCDKKHIALKRINVNVQENKLNGQLQVTLVNYLII